MLDGGTIPNQQPQGPPSDSAINFAPVEPLVRRGDGDKKPWESSSLAEIARELHNEITNRNLGTRREIAEMGRLNANVRSGKLIMKRDPVLGTLALLPPLSGKPRGDRHVYPLAQINSSQLTSIWTLSRPKVLPRNFGNNSKAQIQQSLIEKAIDHYDVQIFTELFHQQESLSMMDYGTGAIRPFYDDKLNAMCRLQPVLANVEKIVFPGFGMCRECLYDDTPDKFANEHGGMGQCPECGSYNLSDMLQPQTAMAQEVVGAREMTQGDISAELLPIPALNWDQRKMIHESPYVQYRSEVPRRLVQSILGIDVAESNPDTDDGLRVLNQIGTRGGSIEGLGQDNLWGETSFGSGTSIMDEEWFAPEYYAGRTLDRDEMTVSGQLVPKDTPLEKVFTDGWCQVGFGDMHTLTWLGNERCRIKSTVYHIQSHSGVGKGTTDSVEVSEQLNIAHSANLARLKRFGAGGGVWFDRDVMSKAEAKALLKPDGLVGIKMRGTQYTSVDQAIKKLEHDPFDAESLAYVAQLSNLMSIIHQADTFTEGAANSKIDVNTATGQQLLQAQNQQRSAAPLRMKGYGRALVFEEILDLFRIHIQIPKVFGVNDRFGLTKSRILVGSDVPEQIKCDFVQESEHPTNRFTKQLAAKEMIAGSADLGEGGFMAIAQFSPRLAAWWASQFPDVEIPLFDQTEILMVCQDRVDKIAEMCGEIEQRSQISGFYPDPAMASAEVVNMLRIPMSEENPVIKAEVIKEYLDDDEVQTWSPLRLASVEALIQKLYENDVANRMRVPVIEQQAQMMMQANAAMAGQALAQPQMDAERANAHEDAALQMGGEQVQKELDFDRDQEAKQTDHKNKIEQIKEQNNGRPRPSAPTGRKSKS